VVAFTAYTWLLQRCPPALVSTHTYANPIVAVLLGWLIASEPLTMRLGLASMAILGAIALVRRGERSAQAANKADEAVAIQNGIHGKKIAPDEFVVGRVS